MDIKRPKKILQKDKNLVAEQSGLSWLFAGLLISVLLGFAVRGLINPQKIQSLVSEAALSLNKDVEIKFESSELSLSDGLFPRFSILVKNIILSSENTCWLKPRLEIDELELPLSFMAMIATGNPISSVEAQNVKLTILGEKRDCTPVVEKPVVAPTVVIAQAVTLVKEESRVPQQAAILEKVNIQKFEIDPLFYPQARTELLDVELLLKSHQPQIITLKAKSNILKDSFAGEYEAHAQISLEYTEFPEKKIEAHVSGNWREGSYAWNTNYKIDSGAFETDADIEHIPMAKLAKISPNTAISKFENMKQVWISLKAQSKGLSKQLMDSPLEVHEFKIEGDSGDLAIEKLDWTKISDPFPKPFLMQMRGLSLQTLLRMSTPHQPSPILNEMGIFTGRAEIEDSLNMKVIGELQGLQFVFANQGQREFQTVQKMSVELNRDQGQWDLIVSRLEPAQGVFNGELSAHGDRELKDVSIKLIADEMSLAPAVQKLMTGGGSLGTLQTKINLGFKNGILDRLQGKFSAQNLEIESFKIPKINLVMQTDSKDGFVSTLQIPELRVPARFVDHSFLSLLKDNVSPTDEQGYDVKQLRSQIRLHDFTSMKWKSLSFALPEGTVSGQAEWNKQGELSGELILKTKNVHKYKLEGTRDNPILRSE